MNYDNKVKATLKLLPTFLKYPLSFLLLFNAYAIRKILVKKLRIQDQNINYTYNIISIYMLYQLIFSFITLSIAIIMLIVEIYSLPDGNDFVAKYIIQV